MTPDEILAIMRLIADLRLLNDQLAAQNQQLRAKLTEFEKVTVDAVD